LANPLLLLVLAVAPAAFLLKYVLIKDKYKPEPLRLVAKTFCFGALSALAAIVLELIFNFQIPYVREFIFVALIEEGVKFGAVWFAAYRSPEFSEVMDGIVYGVAASLGFATVENIIFVFNGGVGTAILRAFLSVPGHAAYGGVLGYYLGLAKPFHNQNKNTERRLILQGLLLALLLHGSFDASLYNLGVLGIVLAVGVNVFSWVIFLRLIKNALAKSPYRWTVSQNSTFALGQRFCFDCGTKIEPNAFFCVNCGCRIQR
jgi:RsiW-degrading membrane proteinase PrsW (M82 family)